MFWQAAVLAMVTTASAMAAADLAAVRWFMICLLLLRGCGGAGARRGLVPVAAPRPERAGYWPHPRHVAVVSGLSRPQLQNQRIALRTARVQVSFLAGRVSLFTGVRFPSGMGCGFLQPRRGLVWPRTF